MPATSQVAASGKGHGKTSQRWGLHHFELEPLFRSLQRPAMIPSGKETQSAAGHYAVFQTTQWSKIECAQGSLSTAAVEALNQLCEVYWVPVYSQARLKGLNHEEASDTTQELFGKLLRNEFLSSVSRGKGRFRTFLLACLDHQIATRWERSNAQKRGGAAEHVGLEAASDITAVARAPDREFDYRWVVAMMREVLKRLEAECEVEGRGEAFRALKGLLVCDDDAGGARRSSECLGISEAAVRAALYRMRKRYKELFREEVARTLASPMDVDDEIRHLLGVFQQG